MSRTTIILHDDEIRGLLDGSRTQLRRPVRWGSYILEERDGEPWPWLPEYVEGGARADDQRWMVSPFGARGARLAVREAWAIHSHPQEGQGCGYWIEYKSDGATVKGAWNPDPAVQWTARADSGWRSAATMPRWACRYALEVGEVRCQLLQDATEASNPWTFTATGRLVAL